MADNSYPNSSGNHDPGQPHRVIRRRDSQQWMLDWMVKTTGRVQNFAYDQRLLPREVKSYRMIPRVTGRYGKQVERLAREAEAAGHALTAAKLYWKACDYFREGQHAIFEDDNPEKIYLHAKVLETFAKVIALSGRRIELVEIPFEGNYLQGLLYLGEGDGPRPTILFCPGMDMTKEKFLDPFAHPFAERGLNCLHIDGPGQGTSNIRKIRVTVDNYDAAGSACLDWLSGRPEVDVTRMGAAGLSMGSYWAMRIAAKDPRVKAVASAAACYGPKRALFEEASPRFKQVFMYMTGIEDEDEFDAVANQMNLDALASEIECPCLIMTGEYDPLCHLEDAVRVYEDVRGPKEMWVLEDDFHMPFDVRNLGFVEPWDFLADWLCDALDGKKPADLDRQLLVRQDGTTSPYGPAVSDVRIPWRYGEKFTGLSASQRGPGATGSEPVAYDNS